jgi:uncharacterized protein (DUF4415 family)
MKQRARVAKKQAGVRRKSVSLKASAESKRWHGSIADIGELYKPIKKPVTLRLDADVLAWFKKQGRGYQTRINRALRKVVEEAGK